MENTKITKLNDEIETIKTKMVNLQSKLRELERKKTIMENDRIIAMVRSEKISDVELGELMRSFRNEKPKNNGGNKNEIDTEY